MRPSIPILAPTSHDPRVVQPTICKRQEKGDDLDNKDKTLIAISPTMFEDSMEFHCKARKIMEEEDGDESKSEFADSTIDVCDVLCSPEPSNTSKEEVRSGAENSESEVGADEVVTIDISVETEITSVVADGETDSEEVEGKENHWVEGRMGDLCDWVDVVDGLKIVIVHS